MSKTSCEANSGNVLFLILIAVALFAALSYAVTQSSRTSGASVGKEQAMIYASEITQIGATMAQGVMKMVLMGTPSSSILTGTPSNLTHAGRGTLNSTADFCTTGATCLFAPEGGGIAVPHPPRGAFTDTPPIWAPIAYFEPNGFTGVDVNGLAPGPAEISIEGVGLNAGWTPGTSEEDLLTIYPLKEEVCLAINKGLGITGIPVGGPAYVTPTPGLDAACLLDSNGYYWYYQVLVPH